MPPVEAQLLGLLRLCVELVPNVALFGCVVTASFVLFRTADLHRARLLIVNGILVALNLEVVATLLPAQLSQQREFLAQIF